jgi:hypothetical protein
LAILKLGTHRVVSWRKLALSWIEALSDCSRITGNTETIGISHYGVTGSMRFLFADNQTAICNS